MVGVRPGVRTAAGTAGAAALALSLPLLGAHDAQADANADAAVAAARWQAGEVGEDGGIPGFAGADWGLTVDTLMALKATGAEPDTATRITDALKVHVRDYNSLDAWGEKGQRVAGATAKLLYAAVITKSDPEKFGAYNLRQETLDLIAGSDKGLEDGRVKDKVNAPSVDNSNTFGQSLAVLGLARSGGVPQNAVDFLIDQQCSAGGFRLYPYAFGGSAVTGDCDAENGKAVIDPDSTGMAVHALIAAADAGVPGAQAAADKGAKWLRQKQAANGSFGGSGPTAAANTNSTGLAGQALAAAGHQAEADKAADWVAGHQLTEANGGKAKAEAGAIAYNNDSLTSAQSDGIEDFQRDQWRRATPQALLALAQVPLGKIGETDPDPGPGPGDNGGTGDNGGAGDGGSGDNGGSGGGPDPSDSATPGDAGGANPSGLPPSGHPSPASVGGGTGGSTGGSGSGGGLAATGAAVLPWAAGSALLIGGGYVTYRTANRRKAGTEGTQA
ncbi:hypothetical protein [Streptomyces boninensis]|uniref:hypothetical protein n=1 Tax=Streptomyces boninensis TaxID=2039455 RepID=UPI003B2255B9